MDQTPNATSNATLEQATAETTPNASATATASAKTVETVKSEKAIARFKDGYERFVQRLSVELREAGKVGKKQWEDALVSTREFVQRARPELKRQDVERMAETVKKDVRHAARSGPDAG